MKAGRELDALVAEKVMGLQVLGKASARTYECSDDWVISSYWEVGDNNEPVYLKGCECVVIDSPEWGAIERDPKIHGHYTQCLGVVLHYSTDIAAAWQVVEKLAREWEYVFINKGNGWGVELRTEHMDNLPGTWTGVSGTKPYTWTESNGIVNADTAPLAICFAALKAA